ncbi:MAG: hypothetical protein MSC30_06090 [Gaiellaceae bacterium MAG52_C11]|nr:hypothetical protein [Candidatus Gaiellasilicea maunaloa]
MAEELRIALLLRSLGYVRLFDPVIQGLLERGHRVHLLHERDEYTDREAAWLHGLEAQPGFTWSVTSALYRDRWAGMANFLRRFTDYVHFLGSDFRGARSLVDRAEHRAHRRVQRLMRLRVMRVEAVRRTLRRVLDALDRSIPSSSELELELTGLRPDVLVLAPHLMPGGRHSEYVKTARALGIPTCMCIASWDNLSSKQLLREIPERVVVWNHFQRDEATQVHGIPDKRVVITGAYSFDEWFNRVPRSREEFCARVGVDPARPYVLFVGGALFAGIETEAEYVRKIWLPDLRGDSRLDELQVLVRSHPRRREQWAAVSFSGLRDAKAWPPVDQVSMPVDEESRADYFDSIYHSAAVVGLNTTAMIEAAAVGRPVHGLLVPSFADSQGGTYHFDYLLDIAGGLVRTSTSLEEHREQLLGTLAHHDEGWERRRNDFLVEFVRPHGLDRPALPFVLDEIEELASHPVQPQRDHRLSTRALRLSLQTAMAASRGVRRVRTR